LILGINEIQQGSIEIQNEPLSNKSTQIAYVPQNTNVNIEFPIKVIEVVMMGQYSSKKTIFGYAKEEIQHALDTLKKVGMQKEANKKNRTTLRGTASTGNDS